MIIYLVTCDKTSFILPATIYLYKKFFTDCPLIRILGFSKPILPDWDNVEFISLAKKQESINLWSTYIYDYLKTIDDKHIFFALDDFFPIDTINLQCLNYVLSYMKDNPVGMCVVSQQPSSDIKRNEVESVIINNDDYFIYKRKKGVIYQLVLQPCIWNREYLLKYLSRKSSPWDFESKLSVDANKDNSYYNISCSNFDVTNPNYTCLMPYSWQSSLSKHWEGLISVLGLKHSIVEELINNNLIDKNKLIIGAWENYTKWNKNFNKDDLQYFSKRGYQEWYSAFSKYY